MTVYEALLFAARLRLPETVTIAEKRSRVLGVMEQLGLSDLANTRIGDRRHRGLSGGEMRRVSIGLELIARPDVLILDEPVGVLLNVMWVILVRLML
jgi:ABC-type multidrug transport system ATPase subunit